MHCAFLIDPLESLKPKKDSSLDLMITGFRRGYRISILDYRDVLLENGEVFAQLTEVQVTADPATGSAVVSRKGAPLRVPLAECDVVFIRKDPPFDSQYLAVTYLLDAASPKIRFVNSPRGVREVNEKLFATHFAEAAPRTLVTWDLQAALKFAGAFAKVVLKPIFLGSGASIFLSSAGDTNFRTCFETILKLETPSPVVVQEYLPEGVHGDTRVMLLNGVPMAALGRRPAQGDFRANIAQGGEAFAVELTEGQRRVATAIGPELAKLGIVFAGLDFIGDKLIETNVTSPTLIQELRRVSGFDMSEKLLDFLERA